VDLFFVGVYKNEKSEKETLAIFCWAKKKGGSPSPLKRGIHSWAGAISGAKKCAGPFTFFGHKSSNFRF